MSELWASGERRLVSRAERGTYKRRPQTHVHSLQGGRDVETDSRKESLRKALDAARVTDCEPVEG